MKTSHGIDSIDFVNEAISFSDDNVDVVIRLAGGEIFYATFFTLKNLESIMKRYKETGECLSGRYLWAKNMIVVDDLHEKTIHAAIHDLVLSGEYLHAFGKEKST
jgi:hypothetical protein